MKKTAKCILCFTVALIFILVGINVSAKTQETEYLITQNESTYTLSRYQSGSPEKLSTSDSLGALLSLCDGARVNLDNITLNENLEISSSTLTLSGSLTSNGRIVIPAGSSLTLDELKLDISSYIRIKGGELNFISSKIKSSTSAIVMDYSSSSRLSVTSGSISTESTEPALSLISGTAEISGGEILGGGAAIESSATLSLLGTPVIKGVTYDISASSPISLSRSTAPFSGTLSVIWQGIFDIGNMYEIFRDTEMSSLSSLSLYDKLGREYEITYFESSSHTDDTCFGAVYLPYEYVFFDGTEKLFTKYYLKGELPEAEPAPERTGYSFLGWYSDEGKTQDFPFSESVISDAQIFASYKLSAPEFSLSSLSFTYDADQRLFGFDSLTHPLSSEGFYTLEWYKNGEAVGNFECLAIKNTSDSGKYFCKITFRHSNNSISVVTPEVSVTVLKRTVKIPTAEPKPYNGKLQYSGLLSTSLYTVTDNGGISAGGYPVILTLKDSENYIFEDGSEAAAQTVFTVTKCQNIWTSSPEIKNYYQNTLPEIQAHSAFGEAYFLYSSSIGGSYTEVVPTLPGDYFCIAKTDGTDNYYELVSEPISFSVLAEIPLGITLNTPPEKTVYKAFEGFSPTGLTVSVIYNSGRRETVGSDSLGIKYQSKDSLLFGDNAVTVCYLSLELSLPVTVEKRAYDISDISFSDKETVYNGKYQAIEIDGAMPVGLDGIPLKATVSAGGVDAGEYTLVLSFSTESRNYILPDNKYATLKILPFSTDVIWGNTVFVYDGTPKLPTAYYVNTDGVKMPLSVTGAQVNAKESALAHAVSSSDNYILKNPTAEFKILKADISFSDVVWSASSFQYNNESKTVTVSGLPAGVSVIGYTDNTARDAGVYTAVAILSYDENNFNPPEPLKHIWTISKLDYDMSGFEFKDSSFIYDGGVHYPRLEGVLPTGLDGITLSYKFTMGLTDATEGAVSVGIIFSTESKNYNCPKELYASVTVEPMPIAVEWSYLGAVYDGKAHIPGAYSEHTAINVSGAMIDAGVYTARAVSASENYSVINDRYTFEISKAENSWLKQPSITDIFASGTPSPTATPKDGEPIFKYYTDQECTKEAELPLTAGVYYMLAYVPEGKNYLAMRAAGVSFEVIAVIPEELSATLNKSSFVSFEVVTDEDIEVNVRYNDGTQERIYLHELDVKYQSGESLRASDTGILIFYDRLSIPLSLTVSKARYDMGTVSWQSTEHIYDGEYKIPTLSGLPEGVRVIEYIGYGKNAGAYSVSARLDYDAENYEMPIIPSASLVIEKCTLYAPIIEPVEYNGSSRYPVMDTSLYRTDFAGAVNVGEYSLKIEPADPENYMLDAGSESIVSVFRITPKMITVSIPEQVLYLWQSPSMPSVELMSELVAGDEMELSFDVIGDTMIISSLNPNYSLENGTVRINRINRPSPDAMSRIIIFFALLMILALLTAAAYLNRNRIKDMIAAGRCRQSFIKEAQIKRIDEIVSSEELTQSQVFSVDVKRADSLISDDLAKELIKREHDAVYTDGKRKCVINIDTVSDNFLPGETVDVNSLKEKALIPQEAGNVKILARGSIDKPLTVKANAFSLSAVKMIALSGGVAIKVITQGKPKI